MKLQEGGPCLLKELLCEGQAHQRLSLGGKVSGGLVGLHLEQGLQAVVLNGEEVAEGASEPVQLFIVLAFHQKLEGGIAQQLLQVPVQDLIFLPGLLLADDRIVP